MATVAVFADAGTLEAGVVLVTDWRPVKEV
jgi:hypothetical protein